MENRVLKKIIIFVTVFMLVFSNCGYTLQVLAATDGITLFGLNLFGSGNIDFDVYFLDENGKKQTENTTDVNSQMTMVLEFTPKAEGYLKSGTIKAVSGEEGETNFKFESAYVENGAEEEAILTINTPAETQLLKSEITLDADNTENQQGTTNDVLEENSAENENVAEGNIVTEDTTVEETVENTEQGNAVIPENANQEEAPETTESNEVTAEAETTEVEVTEPEDEFVDEESALNEESDEPVLSLGNIASATIISDNEILVENVIENTKVYVNISFKAGETLNLEDLYKEIRLEFEGTYINVDLEEVPISLAENVKVGWEYTKDIEVSSEYTKVSPFKIGETEGTIVEDTITVKRDVTDDNYLPLKETKITLNVPSLAGNVPADLDVSALKLKATNGEDINEVTFTKDNWEYDSKKNTLTITVENTNGTFTYGEDIYIVTYRYNTYVEEVEVSLVTEGTVEVTEFSGKDNNVIVKTLEKSEKIIANIGELITYSIGTTEEAIGKGKINANYNQEIEKYESEFSTTVNVNILTNDVLNEFTLKDVKEFYIDKQGLEFQTNDVKYKKVKFRYIEIQEFLEKGGSIEVKNSNGELLYTLNKDLIKSEEDAEISIQGDVRGIEISFKNITVNGNISIEFTKAIGKSSFDKSAFANFQKLESRINAVVKYSEDSEGTDLPEIKTEKEFEESKTEAEITMSKVSLSTTEINENVEFKIEFNNNKENSDLYVNPIFEIAFPKYVSNIDLKAVNMLYEAGLAIGNATTYRAEDGSLRMRIEVNGTQTEFSEGEITNGTNIIINANIELDKYAPRKDDQIKLYYINAGVTNYASQTKWTLGVDVPAGILKTTNGFDSYVFKINAPSGFIAINEIQNYDGENSLVTSIRQGEETREIAMEKGVQVARMNLIAINNTENQCTDVTFLGRIPAKGVTDVKTGEALETNIDAVMISRITENEDNPLSAKIYYSANPDADKNLNDSANGWTENPEDLSGVRAFLIVPDSKVEPGYIFRYTYEFFIPENLPYETKIYGAFGAFYNNHSDVAVTYEATTADLVGLVTQAGPKVEAVLSVNVGDGAEVPEASFLDYTLTVANSGSVTAEGITVTNPIPEGTTLYTEKLIVESSIYGWFSSTETELTWQIEKLEPGEVKEFTYTVKIQPNMNISEIKNKATVHVSNLALDINSNEIGNKLRKSNVDIDIYSDVSNSIRVGENFGLVADIKNISGKDLKNVTIEYKVPEELSDIYFVIYEEPAGVKIHDYYDSENNIFTLIISELKLGEELQLKICATLIYGNNDNVPNIITVSTQDGTVQASKPLEMTFDGPKLEATQVCSVNGNTIKEGENVEFIFSIQNNGNIESEDTSIYSLISENLENVIINTSGSSIDNLVLSDNNELVSIIYWIPSGECVNIHISGTVKDVEDDTKTISSKMLISNQYIKDITTNEIVLKILNDPNRKSEESIEQQDDRDIIKESEDFIIEEVPSVDEKKDEENTELEEQDNKDTQNTEPEEQDNKDTQNTEPEEQDNEDTQSTEPEEQDNKDTQNTESEDPDKKDTQNTEPQEQDNKDTQNTEQEDQDNKNMQNTEPEEQDSKDTQNTTKENQSSSNTQNTAKESQSSRNIQNTTKENQIRTNTQNNTTPTLDNNSSTNTEQEEEQEVPKYSISGKIWLDINKNGILEENENGIAGVQIQLQKDNISVKATVSPRDGSYVFRDVEPGRYAIVYTYDNSLYTTTVYKNIENGAEKASYARDLNNGKAVTDAIVVGNGDVQNINLGLKDKDVFDLTISKTITFAKVTTNGKTTEHKYNNLDLAKLEISAKDLNKATVELHYQIIVKNEGNVSGKAMQIVDYLPKDTTLDIEQSKNWYLGSDGKVYNDSLAELSIEAGETRTLNLVLIRTMTTENTGVVANKVAITKTEGSTDSIVENTTNNNATQELLISVRTGYTAPIIINIIIITSCLAIVYLERTQKIKINFKKLSIKRIYK